MEKFEIMQSIQTALDNLTADEPRNNRVHDELDGQDYETAANLIGGNQFIAAANFIDRLDTAPREHMITLIYKNKKLWNEMWYYDDDGYFCTRQSVCASFKPRKVA